MAITEKTLKDGRHGFMIDYYVKGDRKYEMVEGSYYVSKRDRADAELVARNMLRQRRLEVKNGTWKDPHAPGVVAPEAAPVPTFAEFRTTFIERYGSACRSTYYTDITATMAETFGPKRLNEITQGDVETFAAARARQVKPSTRRKELSVLGLMFRKAEEWEISTGDPTARVKRPRAPRPDPKPFTRETFAKALEAVQPAYRPLVLMALAGALRLKEVVNIRTADVDRNARTLRLDGDNKTGDDVLVPLNDLALKVIGEQDAAERVKWETACRASGTVIKRSEYLFTDADMKSYIADKTRNRISANVSRAFRRAGVAATFKTTRTTAACWLVEAGVHLLDIKEVCRHQKIETTMWYARSQKDRHRAAVDKITLDVVTETATCTPEAPAPAGGAGA